MQVKESKTVNRWFKLGVGVLCMFFAGIIYAWSILKTPFADQFGWETAALSVNYTLTMSMFCIGGVFSGLILKRYPPRVAMVIAGLAMMTGFLFTAANKGNLVHLYLSYGILAGGGIGMVYNAVLSATNAWFPDRKGLCAGTLMMGFGISTLVLGNVAARLFDMEGVGWQRTYVLLALVVGGVLLFSAFVIRYPKPEEAALYHRPSANLSYALPEIMARRMVRMPVFWVYFFLNTLVLTVGNTIISFARDLSLSVGVTVAWANLLVGILAVCNGFGRIFIGVIVDRYGLKRALSLTVTLVITAATLTLVALLLHEQTILTFGLAFIGLSYGCMPPISSTFITTRFGAENFPMNFSILNAGMIAASLLVMAGAALQGMTSSYAILVSVLIVLGFIAWGLKVILIQRLHKGT